MHTHRQSMTADALAIRADASADFEHDAPAVSGTLFFDLDRQQIECQHGYEYTTEGATLIGLIITGDDDGDRAAPEILTRDEAVDRFGLRFVETHEAAQIGGM